MRKFKTMDDIVLEYRGDLDLTSIFNRTIKKIKKYLKEKVKEENVTPDFIQSCIKTEKEGKNRLSLLRWLKFSLETGEFPEDFYLDFMGEVGIWKSALQKYIRRGNVDKAVKVAYKLNAMHPASLIRRLKVILPEDCYSSIDLYTLTDIDPVTVAGCAAERYKDGHCCRAFNEIKDSKEYEKGYDLDWLKDNYKEGDFAKVVSMLFALRREKEIPKINNIFKKDLDLLPTKAGNFIMNELLSSSKVDYDLTLVAVLRMIREGYDVVAETVDKDKYKSSEFIQLNELDWYVFDFHTFPGRVVKDRIAKKFSLKKKELAWTWWFGESSYREDEAEPSEDYKPYYMTPKERQYMEDWKEIKEDVKDEINFVNDKFFKLDIVSNIKV